MKTSDLVVIVIIVLLMWYGMYKMPELVGEMKIKRAGMESGGFMGGRNVPV